MTAQRIETVDTTYEKRNGGAEPGRPTVTQGNLPFFRGDAWDAKDGTANEADIWVRKKAHTRWAFHRSLAESLF